MPANRRSSNWSILFLLLLLGFGVVAVLSWQPESSLLPAEAPDVARPAPSGIQTAVQAASNERPFEDAIRAQQRGEAQSLLQQMLPLLTRLEEENAAQWAPAEYEAILEQASRGDSLYSESLYEAARDAYQSALAEARALVDSIPQRLQQAVAAGEQALETGDVSTADASFDLALQIDADSPEAQLGKKRAAVNAEVMSLSAEADALATSGDYSQALSTLERARTLDPQLDLITAQINRTDRQWREQKFRQAMSAGFQALSERRFADADRNFQVALGTGIGDPAARAAMDQVVAERQVSATDRALAAAAELETGEQWQQALDIYRNLYAQDGSLVEARLGKLRSEARAELDQRLEEVLADPLLLQDSIRRASAEKLLADARQVAGRGPKLTRQIDSLAHLLQAMLVPREVIVQSDGQTDVEILRVGAFGTIRERVLELPPGHYVAVGTRSGYRDVRVEFTIGVDSRQSRIDVRTTERIAP